LAGSVGVAWGRSHASGASRGQFIAQQSQTRPNVIITER
jgi:hypothetical protein